MAMEIKLPELGDGIESGDVLDVLVAEGDTIDKDQGLIEIETDKATVEIPSPEAGKVVRVHVEPGQTLAVGGPIVTIEPLGVPSSATPAEGAPPESASPPPAVATPSQSAASPPGPSPASTDQAAAKGGVPAEPATEEPLVATRAATPPPAPSSQATTRATETPPPAAQVDAALAESGPVLVPAGPVIRRLAREVGVDLTTVQGTGPGGRITRDDVLAVVRQSAAHHQATTASGSAAAAKPATDSSATSHDPSQPLPDSAAATASDAWGPIRIEPMSRIRKTIATKMHESWSTVPRVTNFDDADVTELEEIRQDSKTDYAERGIKLTSLPFVIKAVALALKSNPTVNASIDMDQGQIVYKEYVHIGIAMDTERGLLVPALRDVDQLGIAGIARALAQMVEKVRSGNVALDDLRGSTFSISNLGAVGGTYSTPIVNIPEVAILLLGRSRLMPVVHEGTIQPRLMMPLSLSYDHRLVDGAMAARFLNDVIAYLERPGRLLIAP